jgi:phage terminase small subunit
VSLLARAPDERVQQAHDMYKKGMKLVEIASQLSLPDGTVRRWKSTYNWDNNERSEKKSERSKKNRENKEVFDDGTKETMLNENLTHEQRLFCIYYSKIFNATQSYQKAYGCSYESAMVRGCELLRNVKVKDEIQRLNELKRQQIVAKESDLVELHMRIAFADIGNYISFGREEVPVMTMFGPMEDKETGEKITKVVNTIKVNESENVDTQLIQEVKQGKDGFSIKLADKQKSMEWLDKFFLMNPMDKHKIAFDNRKQESEIEEQRIRIKKLEADLAKATGSSNENELTKLDEMLQQIKKQAGDTNDTE